MNADKVCKRPWRKTNSACLSVFVLLCLSLSDLTQGIGELPNHSEGAALQQLVVSNAASDFVDATALEPKEKPLGTIHTILRTFSQRLLGFAVDLRGNTIWPENHKQGTVSKSLQAEAQPKDGRLFTPLKDPSLEAALQGQLRRLNRVLASGNVHQLLGLFAPTVRVFPPGRPAVEGHGADLVFALQTLFETKVHRSVIQEDVIPLQQIHLKGQNDPDKTWFLLTRNSFNVMNKTGLTQAGKALILWQLVPGLANPNANPESQADDAKGRLLIRWLIWNDDGDSAGFPLEKEPRLLMRAARRAEVGQKAKEELGDTSLRSLYCDLRERWSAFNHALTRGDFTGCMDLTSPDTVIMPPGNPALRGGELKEVCEAFVQAGVRQQIDINEAFLFKGRRIVQGRQGLTYTKVKYFVLENDAFTNSYVQSNITEVGKQVIFWEVYPRKSSEGSNSSPSRKGTLKWAWTLWNSDEPDNVV